MAIKYTSIFHFKALQNFPKLGLCVVFTDAAGSHLTKATKPGLPDDIFSNQKSKFG
jgi:hypothetical protein